MCWKREPADANAAQAITRIRARLLAHREVDDYYARSISLLAAMEPHALGPLEMEVLGLLDPSEPLAVAAIQARLAGRGHELAYTTVMTVLVRLHKKGLATRVKEGNRFLYTATRRAPGVSEGILTKIRRSLFQSDRMKPILALLDDDELTDDELRALRRVIDERRRGRRS